MKVAALFSGGKDSTYAIYIAQQWGWEVTKLISLAPTADDSYMFHVPNISLTSLLSEALGIHFLAHLTNGKEEAELTDLKNALTDIDVDGVITGAIASDYQTSRINKVCYDLGLKVFNPLWRKDQSMLLMDMVHAGFKIMIVGVYAEGLGREWLGRIIDENCLQELHTIARKYKINVSGEGGEYETLVVDGPIFSKSLEIEEYTISWDGCSGTFQVLDARLI